MITDTDALPEDGQVCGFPPFFDGGSRVLILGSFPSVKSREVSFYYGNKLNSFWRILASFFKEELPVSVQDKRDFLSRHNIALWDMVQKCTIKGSSDAAIKNFTVVNLQEVLQNCPIEFILLNGGKASQLFERHYKDIGIPYIKLPSTSPANTKPKEGIWHDALRRAFDRT